mmetsp:Transcript_17464/g.25819  ORF Transcript_17464/g.25819 Transcript_17464/m.25819 type:complete len:81 (+) Transcript_17464:1045-1287(+)
MHPYAEYKHMYSQVSRLFLDRSYSTNCILSRSQLCGLTMLSQRLMSPLAVAAMKEKEVMMADRYLGFVRIFDWKCSNTVQ